MISSIASIDYAAYGDCAACTIAPPSPQHVHVWQWDLDAGDQDQFDRYWESLSIDERERAGQFRSERHRRRFVVGRGALRRILGRYLALPPQAVALEYGPEGKPFCANQPAQWTLSFNLSHSANAAALAIARGFDIGIDVERVRPIEDNVPLEAFSEHERVAFAALPEAQRQAVFFENWSRKEACLKALGTGFTLPPTHFEFDLSIRGDTTPRCVGGDTLEAAQWRVRALSCGPACAGVVAARHADWSIVKMDFDASPD